MVRGFLSGAVWGLIVSVVGLSVASLMAEQPAGNTPPQAPQVEAPARAAAEPQMPPPPTEPGIAPDQPALPSVPSVPAPVVESAAPAADTTPAAVPRTAPLEETLARPVPGTAPRVAAEREQPVLPNPQGLAPQVPVAEEDIVLSTDPGAPQPPATAAPESAAAEVVILDPPAPEAAPEADADPAGTTPDLTEALPAETAPEASAPELPAPAVSGPEDDPVASDAPVLVLPEEEDAAPIIAVPETAAPRLALQGDAPALPEGDGAVRVRRPETTVPAAPAASDPTEAVDPDDPALLRFATPFDNPEGKPLLSVVLIDDGSLPGAVPAVAGMGVPVTVAIDASRPGAAEALAAWRAAGIEVAALAPLPAGAHASDAAVTLEAAFGTLDQVVALVDATGAWQASADVTTQAIDLLAEDGHGAVLVSQGLNAGLRTAAAAGVPAVVVYRDLDGEGQDARVIRRFMDQAAFRARQVSAQEPGIVLLARIRADTLSALTLWGTANRAGQVALAPVSAVLSQLR